MHKSKKVEFYFDCSSPWTYLAFKEILPLSQRQNLEIIWKPILVGGVFNEVNQEVYQFRKSPNHQKLAYSSNDLELWAKLRRVKIQFPKVFPVNSVKAMRGCLFAIQEGYLVEFATNIFETYWGLGLDISQDNILLDVVKKSSMSLEEFNSYIASQAAKDLLVQNSQELISLGGFGSPTFYFNGQMFFGNDRLHLLEQAITQELL